AVAELEHPRGHRVSPLGHGAQIAELLEGAQEASGGGTRNARTARDLGQREGRGLAVERLDHSQPSREGLDEVPAGRARSGGFVARSHIETLALEHDREALPDADADRG